MVKLASSTGKPLAAAPVVAFWIGSAVFMYMLLSSKQLVGWDTPAYTYYSGVLSQDGLGEFLIKTYYGSQGVLYYFLMVVVHNISGYSFFVCDKLLASVAFGGILVAPSVAAYRWTGKISLTLVVLAFSMIWQGPYVLASNLHSNELGLMIALFGLTLALDAIVSGGKALVWSTMLFLLASISHPQTSAYLGVVMLCSATPLILRRRSRSMAIRVLVLLVASCSLLLFSTVMLGQPRVIGPILVPAQALEAQQTTVGLLWALELMGHNVFPLFAFSVVVLAVDLAGGGINGMMDKRRLSSLLLVLWVASTLSVWLLSYVWLTLYAYADRLLLLSPVPLVIALGLERFLNRFGVRL